MIIFKTIRYKNLLSTGNQFTTIPLNDHKTTLIVGKNGSGKSTMIEALSFGLYGKPYRKINKPQLINSITKKDMVIEIEFSVDDVEYKIIRGIKPAIFELYKNGNLLNQDAASKDYQETLEKQILKINHKSFCQVLVLGTASFVPFMQLTAQARRDIIEDLLDLQIFTTMNVLLKDRNAANGEELTEVLIEKKTSKTQLDMMKSYYDTVQKSNEKFIEERQSKIVATEILLNNAEKEISEIFEQGDSLKTKLLGKESVKANITKAEQFKIKFKESIRNLEKEMSFYIEHENCPICHQNIDQEFREIKKKEIVDNIKNLDLKIERLGKQRDDWDKELEIFNNYTSELQDLSLKLSQINAKKAGWSENIQNWQTEIKDVNENNQFISQDRIEDVENVLRELDERHMALINEKDILVTTQAILKDGGIKSTIIKQYVPIINQLINKYLAAMDFFVNFELNEQFEETIKSRGHDDFSYGSFSEGEKLRIDLAVLFTWRAIAKMRNSVNTNLLIMDEVFDSSLDVNGADEFMKIIRNMAADNNTFVISHRSDQLGDKFDHMMEFEKIKNFSKRK